MRFLSLILARPLPFVLTQIYIEALLVDEDLADQVWELWNADLIGDHLAAIAWYVIWRYEGDNNVDRAAGKER